MAELEWKVEDWRSAITSAMSERPQPVAALSYVRTYPTDSHPVLLSADNGKRYVVKARQLHAPARVLHFDRVLVNDQIVGLLGKLIGAPVPPVALIDVPKALIDGTAGMRHMEPGVCHGSEYIPGSTGRLGVRQQLTSANRSRFAQLAVLYGWVLVTLDHQFIYTKDKRSLVFSVDHGHCFPAGPVWQANHLALAQPAKPDSTIVLSCNLKSAELHAARMALTGVTRAQLAKVVSMPPDSWACSLDERALLAMYLHARRNQLLACTL